MNLLYYYMRPCYNFPKSSIDITRDDIILYSSKHPKVLVFSEVSKGFFLDTTTFEESEFRKDLLEIY